MSLNLKNHLPLIYLLSIGLIIRIFLAFLPGFKIDVDDWFYWANRLAEVGPFSFYHPEIFTDYLPGYLYVLGFLGLIKNFFNLTPDAFYYLLKLPAIFSEIVLAFFVYQSLKNHSTKKALVVSSFVIFNPAFIFNSSIWGQIDGVLALFMFLSIYFLYSKKLIYASVFLSLAFLIKPQAISIFPIFLLYLIKDFSKKTSATLILPGLLTAFFVSLPFFPTNPFLGLIQKFFQAAAQYNYTSLFAYNIWGLVGFWIDDQTKFLSLNYQTIGILLFAISWLFISYLYFTENLNLYLLSALACLAFFFLPTRVHERYLYPALIFLITGAAFLKTYHLSLISYLLSLIHFFNLYYVYTYYNIYYFKLEKVIYWESFYKLLDTLPKMLSFISTILFLITCLYVFRDHEKKRSIQT